jgi:hypothetical protein
MLSVRLKPAFVESFPTHVGSLQMARPLSMAPSSFGKKALQELITGGME